MHILTFQLIILLGDIYFSSFYNLSLSDKWKRPFLSNATSLANKVLDSLIFHSYSACVLSIDK